MSEENSLERVPKRSSEVPATITVPAYTVPQEEEESLPLLEYWRILRKRRWTVLSVMLLLVVTVVIGTLKQQPVYRAEVVLQIDRESQNILNFKDFVADINPYDESHLETAYKVLRSRTLARRVIEKLDLDQVAEFDEKPSLLRRVLRWRPSSVPEGVESDPHTGLIGTFLDRLAVEPVRNSRLVKISFESYDPVLTARIVNTLASNYIDQNLEVKWEATQKASEWLSQQLVGLQGKLEQSEEELQRYAKENSILFIDEKQSMSAQKLKQLEEEYTRSEAERIQEESLYNQVRTGEDSSIPGMLENRLYQELSVRCAELKRQHSELSATFTPEYPKVKRLQFQIDELERSLENERMALTRRVRDNYLAAVHRERLLEQVVARETRQFNQIAEKSIQYNILKREVDTNKQLYDGLLQRLKEAGVSAGLRASNVRVVDTAEVPLQPARPRKLLNLALGLFLGLGLGIGLALFQEYLDNTLKTPNDVQRFLRLPALAGC